MFKFVFILTLQVIGLCMNIIRYVTLYTYTISHNNYIVPIANTIHISIILYRYLKMYECCLHFKLRD